MHDAQDKPSNVDTARYELPLVFETKKKILSTKPSPSYTSHFEYPS